MIVIVLSACPMSLKGDLTKWFFEISTNVYVGRVSARVRDELWVRITRNINEGHAIMVYSVRNEQGFDFITHNIASERMDLDGLIVLMKPAGNVS